jgi:hypothetical protein
LKVFGPWGGEYLNKGMHLKFPPKNPGRSILANKNEIKPLLNYYLSFEKKYLKNIKNLDCTI